MANEPAVLLNYSTPRCFFEREYRFRSWHGVIGAAVLLVCGGFVAFMARWFAKETGVPFTIARIALWTIAAACAAGVGWVVFNLIRNAVDVARITEEGIEQNGRLYPWERVADVGGAIVVGGVLIEYHLRPAPGSLSLSLTRTLITTPALNREEFDALIRVLGDYLGAEHRHVTLDPVPRSGD